MSSPVSTVDDATAVTGEQEAAPEDGWRPGGLLALRAELDRIDDAMHDLLMQRAEIVEHVARSGKPAAFRPGREASIIRRLLTRHQGTLPPLAVVRIWRELLAGTTSMQGGFSVAVCDVEHAASITQLAREHFGALTPLRAYASASQALVDVSQGVASVAILPYPSESNTWWVALLHHEPRLHVIGRLPFWTIRAAGAPAGQALVVASTPADASGDDHSILGFECDSAVSKARLFSELSGAGLQVETMVVARQPGSPAASVMADVDGYLCDDDPRLIHLRGVLRRPVVFGSYALPFAGNRP
jgi:chorismate mutase/prephenate dehydratase